MSDKIADEAVIKCSGSNTWRIPIDASNKGVDLPAMISDVPFRVSMKEAIGL